MAGPAIGTLDATGVLEVLQGPAILYIGATTATLPLDTAVNSSPQASAFTEVGATDGGVTITVEREFAELTVDQVPETVGRRLTAQNVMVATSIAQATLDNLAYALNDSTASTGSGYSKLVPAYSTTAMFPTYRTILVDGWAPGTNKRRRLVCRRVLSVEAIEGAYGKEDKFMIPVTWATHYVDDSTEPWYVVDET